MRQERFGLEELIRVRPLRQEGELAETMRTYSTILGGPNDLYLLARPGNGILGAGWKDRLVPAWYFEPVEALDGGTVVMDIVTGDGRRPVVPGLVASRYGKGRVLYSASSIESLFAGNNEQVLGDLVRDMVLSASACAAQGRRAGTYSATDEKLRGDCVDRRERGGRPLTSGPFPVTKLCPATCKVRGKCG